MFHHFAVAIAAVLVEPACDLWKVEPVLHHEPHRDAERVVAFGLVELVLDVIEQLADRVLAGGERIEKGLELMTAQLFEILDLAFS